MAIAAAKAGARTVLATDIDEHALAAIALNAAANAAPQVVPRLLDLAAAGHGDAEVILAADVFYQRDLAAMALAFLKAARRGAGATVLAADPARAFVPTGGTRPPHDLRDPRPQGPGRDHGQDGDDLPPAVMTTGTGGEGGRPLPW